MQLSHLAIVLNCVAVVLAGGGFADTCNSITYNSPYLKAICGDGRGGWPAAQLDLNTCLGNADGVLQWQPNGGAPGSCTLFAGPGTDGAMDLKCQRNDGTWDPYQFVYLNNHISNQGGVLSYDGFRGSALH